MTSADVIEVAGFQVEAYYATGGEQHSNIWEITFYWVSTQMYITPVISGSDCYMAHINACNVT